ncbi:MAG: urease accessory protein [Alphaproteobacteria bacterium]
MWAALALGFFIGISHAFEADHLAAVSSLVSGKTGVAHITRFGAIWGVGHALVMMVFGGLAIGLQASVAADYSAILETIVAVMLVGLGGHVLYRLHRDRVHIHRHRHENGNWHLHAHSHIHDKQPHQKNAHHHAHPRSAGWRTLAVGMMHGLAGTAALTILVSATTLSPGMGYVYIALFGLGSMAGMAGLTMIIALPLSLTARFLTRINRLMQAGFGLVTMAIGVFMLVVYGAAAIG